MSNSEAISYVTGLILDKEKVLLVQKNMNPLAVTWGLPGGNVENGETPEQALAQRIYDQLGIRVAVASKVATVKLEFYDSRRSASCYFCTIQEGSFRPQNDQILKWIYFAWLSYILHGHSAEGIHTFWPLDRTIVEAVFANNSRHEMIGKQRNTLFEYCVSSAWGCVGGYGGKEIRLDKDGMLIYCEYLLGFDNDPFYQRSFSVSREMVSEIEKKRFFTES